MSATVAAALKKLALAVVSNPKVLKRIGGIILGVIIIIVMPIAAVLGIFSGDINIDTERLQEMIQENMTEEERARLQIINDTMISIEEQMTVAGYSTTRVKEAQVLYTLALAEFSTQDSFVNRLVGCFAMEQTDEQLIANVNTTFGTQISLLEFCNVMNGIRKVYIDTSDYYDAATKNNIDLVKYAIHAEQSGWGYVWGTYGQVLTEKTLKSLITQYPKDVGDYEAFIKRNWLGGRTTDCGGLIKGYAWLNVENNRIEYGSNGMPALRADEIYEAATEKGTIDTIPEIQGLAVWKKGHIGVYIGSGEVIEAMSTEVGVIRTELSQGAWVSWLKIPNIIYIEEAED